MKNQISKKAFPLSVVAVLAALAGVGAKHNDDYREFPANKLKPGETQASDLKRLLGPPIRSLREAGREYYFYDLGDGATMDSTVFVKGGVVEYATFLCDENVKDARKAYEKEFPGEAPVTEKLPGGLSQVLLPKSGKGFVVNSRSMKVRACISFKPGTTPQG